MDLEDGVGVRDGKIGDAELLSADKDNTGSNYVENGIEKHAEEDKDETITALVDIKQEHEPLFHYDVFEVPPFLMTMFFAMQQALMSLSRGLSTTLLVADVVCARKDENFKARLLSTTLFLSGITTFLQNTIGIRLPLYQGPAMTYVVPLLAMSSLPEWRCPDFTLTNRENITMNESTVSSVQDKVILTQDEFTLRQVQKLEGSLMIAGALHMLVGMTGVVGILLRFIGPITIVPALTIIGLVIYRATTTFAKTQWPVALLTVSLAMVLSFYLRRRKTPIPVWTRGRGFHIHWFPFHQMFAVLISCIVGWLVSAALTAADLISDNPKSPSFYARTDSRLHVIEETSWFTFPYPGQFGPPGFDTGALITFLMGTLSSIIDSIGDYYACAKICDAPPPPDHAANRGIAVEGFMSFIGGWCGASHATSTFGGNIGAIGITRVASLRVFQVVGLIYICFGVVGKIGAVFVTIPYSVIGGMMIINFGVLTGVMLSNLQFIDLSSTRNLAIIGMSMLASLMFPFWIETSPNAINTGIKTLDNVFTMFLANPAFIAGALACFLDNTIPGTYEERGMVAWQSSMGVQTNKDVLADAAKIERQTLRLKKLRETIYIVPFAKQILKKCPYLGYLPFMPRQSVNDY